MSTNDVGRLIWARDRSEAGTVTALSRRYCAACQRECSCYIVLWPGGNKTKPCTKGVEVCQNGDLHIM